MDAIWSILWLIVIFSALSPAIHQRYLEAARQSVIHQLERKRRSRLITLIHRQENVSLLGVPIARYITMEDSEAVLTAIRSTPPNVPIDLVLHTPGGLVLAAEQIARALYNHPAKTTVIIPHYAMSTVTTRQKNYLFIVCFMTSAKIFIPLSISSTFGWLKFNLAVFLPWPLAKNADPRT